MIQLNNSGFYNIPIKDLFYLIGIGITLFLGIKNIKILNTNKKNSLRESVYKEQIIFMFKLSAELNNLRKELTFLSQNKEKIEETALKKIHERIIIIHEVLFDNAVVCSSKILNLTYIMISKSRIFIEHKGEKKTTDKENFDNYFSSFMDIISAFKIELGIINLTKENQALYSKDQEILKKIR